MDKKEEKRWRYLTRGLISLVYLFTALMNLYFDRDHREYFNALTGFYWFYLATEQIWEYVRAEQKKKTWWISFSLTLLAGLSFLYRFYRTLS